MVVSKQTGIQYRATGEDHVNSMIDIGSLGKDIKLGYKVGAIRTKKGHLRNDIEIGMPACVLIDEQNVPANLCDPVMLLIYMHDFIRDEVVSKLEPFLCSPARPEDKG